MNNNMLPTPTAQPLKIQGLPTAAQFHQEKGAIVTFGIFDGVHRGHQLILEQLRRRAEELCSPAVVIIFRPRPIETLPEIPSRPYLSAQDETVRQIRALGIRHVGVLKFTQNLAFTPAPQFLQRLTSRVPIRELWMGAESTVGRGTEGTFESVKVISRELGFSAHSFEPVPLTPKPDLLLDYFDAGDLKSVTSTLGRSYKLPAYVIQGSQPDPNGLERFQLVTPDLLYIPPDGTYLVHAHPVSFDGVVPPSGAVSNSAVLIIRTGRISGSKPQLFLVLTSGQNWVDSYVILEFVASLEPNLGALWTQAKELKNSM